MFSKVNNEWPPVVVCTLQGVTGIFRRFGDDKYILVNRPGHDYDIHAEIASRLTQFSIPSWNHTAQGLPHQVCFRGGAVFNLRGIGGGGMRYHTGNMDQFVDTLTVIENLHDYVPQ